MSRPASAGLFFAFVMKKYLSLTGIILAAALTCACGIYLCLTLHPERPGVTTIRWVVGSTPIRAKTIEYFESLNPDIKVINDVDAGMQRILTQLAGDVAPDVFTAYDVEALRTFYNYGLLTDLTPYLKQYDIPIDDFFPTLRDYLFVDGKLVGIPENQSTLCLFYNKTMFDEAGLAYPDHSWTWEDMKEAARKLTLYKDAGGRKISVQKGLMVFEDPHFFVWMYGGSVYTKDGRKCIIDSPEARKGMREWEELRMKDRVVPSPSEIMSLDAHGGDGGDQMLFGKNKVAMFIGGRDYVTYFREYFKDLEYGIARLPKCPCKNNILFSKSYCIPVGSKHKEEAVRFLVHLTNEANQNLVSDYGDGVPSIDKPSIIKNFLFNPDYPKETENRNVLDELAVSRPLEVSPYISLVDFRQISNYEIGNVWLGTQDMDTACRNIAKRVNEVIERNIKNPRLKK